jgi:hypothetical protein
VLGHDEGRRPVPVALRVGDALTVTGPRPDHREVLRGGRAARRRLRVAAARAAPVRRRSRTERSRTAARAVPVASPPETSFPAGPPLAGADTSERPGLHGRKTRNERQDGRIGAHRRSKPNQTVALRFPARTRSGTQSDGRRSENPPA